MKTITVELWDEEEGEEYTVDFPAHNVLCPECGGEGSTYLGWRSEDQPAYTQEDFDDDPDFEEGYFGGAYDRPCPECKGLRVTLEVDDPSTWTPAQLEELLPHWERWQRQEDEEAAYRAEVRAERRFGC